MRSETNPQGKEQAQPPPQEPQATQNNGNRRLSMYDQVMPQIAQSVSRVKEPNPRLWLLSHETLSSEGEADLDPATANTRYFPFVKLSQINNIFNISLIFLRQALRAGMGLMEAHRNVRESLQSLADVALEVAFDNSLKVLDYCNIKNI